MQQDILSQVKTTNVNLKDDVCKSISLSSFFQLFIKLHQFIFQLFSLSDESDETSFTDDSCESKSKKNLYLSNLQEKIKALKIKNKQLQNEVTALKRSITIENSNSVVIKHLSNMNETQLFISVTTLQKYCFRDGKLG